MMTDDPVWPFLHLLSVLLMLPGFLFSTACLMLRRAFGRHSFWGFVDTVLSFVAVLLPWGAAVLGACFLTLAAAGFSAQWRHAAAGVVLALAAASAAVMLRVARLKDSGQGWFYAPGLAATLIAGWLLLGVK